MSSVAQQRNTWRKHVLTSAPAGYVETTIPHQWREMCPGIRAGTKTICPMLSKPTWSVKSLLPADPHTADAPTITPKQLRHLLNLSALPEPRDEEEEARMLKTLRSQLHFVRAIQEVDTKDVPPLRAIRDETDAAEEEIRISLGSLKEALAEEEVRGKHFKRIQRKEGLVDTAGAEDWDVLGHAERKTGKYFVVDSGKT
ncbi:hypothetical protein SLS56_001643 [Neofusicoccum ribis]|uniref:Glutamyl-tRNA amidotransferase complex subunit Gta3 domain-containing protein n=1 Tax=Neofusicoccum ribis TaxID=45134 RepID=A0ABR3T7R6_9PEZI